VTVDAQWSLLRISPSGRTLVIGTPGGGCFRPPQVTVEHEDAVAVQLQVRMTYLVPDGEREACTADFRVERALVTLSAPLAGRRLVDQWRLSLFTIPSSLRHAWLASGPETRCGRLPIRTSRPA
jgi:hypothetical protein